MLDPWAVHEKLVKAGDKWADANAAADLLERAMKSAYSNCVIKHRKSNCPVSEAEHLAQIDTDYQEAVSAAIEARQAANKAKVHYDSGKTWAELLRTKEATERAAARHAT